MTWASGQRRTGKCSSDEPARARRDHEPVPAESRSHPDSLGERVDDRLPVRRHVVDARGDDRKRHVLQRRQQPFELLVDSAPPPVLLGHRIAFAAQVACEHAPARELLRRDSAIDRDHERFEQALSDRLTEKEGARFLDDRQLEAERRKQRARLRAGRDDDGIGGNTAA